MRGRFISLEGGEGVGKSTQAKRLAKAIRARGHDVIETREPGGSAGAEAIRQLLLQGEEDRWTPQAEALLFAAARADHVAKLIAPSLDAGKWVLCDRFLDSSIAYQGAAGEIGAEAVRTLHRIGARGRDYHAKVVDAFDALAAQDPGRYRIVDAGGEANAVTARLFAAIEDLL